LSSIFGCDSVVELTLTVNPVFFVPITAAICQGNSYNFNGKTLTIANIYYDTLSSIFGCDSVIELTLSVNSVYFTQISDSISAGSSYNFNGKNLTKDGIYYDTLQTLFGCDSIVELTLKVTSVGIVGAYGIRPIQIYPNPAQNELFIKSDFRIEKVEIYTIVGSLVFSEGNFKDKISVSALPTGFYLLKVYTDNGLMVRKFVKE
jgi:hypothetical protein